MTEKQFEEAQKDFLSILKRIKYFLDDGKYDTARTYTANEYYILKNDLFSQGTKSE